MSLLAAQIRSFASELEKLAIDWSVAKNYGKGLLARIAAGGGTNIALGGAIGAGAGYVASDPETRARNMVLGGLLGSGLMTSAILSTKEGREAAKRFLKRQRYSITGGGVKNLAQAEEIGLVPRIPEKMPEDYSRGFLHWIRGMPKEESWKRNVEMLKQHREAFNKGLLSLPGIVRSPIEALKHGWRTTPAAGKALIGGLTGLDIYRTAMTPRRPGESSKGEAITRSLVAGLGGMATPFSAGGMLLQGLTIPAAGRAYRAVESFLSRPDAPQKMEQSGRPIVRALGEHMRRYSTSQGG